MTERVIRWSTSPPGRRPHLRDRAARALGSAAVIPLLLLMLAGPAASAYATTAPGPVPEVIVSDNVEGFRLQMLDFARELDEALFMALQDPSIGPVIAQQLSQRSMQSPFPEELFRSLQFAQPDQIEQLRQAVLTVPGVLSSPTALRATLVQVQQAQLAGTPGTLAGACSGPIDEYFKIVSAAESLNALVISKNSVGLLAVIAAIADKIADDGTGECELIPPFCIQVPTSWLQSPFTIALAIFEVTDIALDIAAAEMQFRIIDAQRCKDPLTPHGFSDYKRDDTAKTLAGRGCDNRDNDETEGIDEIDEDQFAPSVSFDEAIGAHCFRTEAAARAAAMVAAKGMDDCAAVDPNVAFSFDAALCRGTAVATVSDLNTANPQAIATATLTIDGVAPAIALPQPAACYADLAAATAAFSPGAPGVAINDCTGVQSDLKVTEKECVADLELSAVDACGNVSSSMVSVRVDDTPPAMKIDTLLLPTVGGLHCFATEAEAVATVTEATSASDNCTAREDLVVTASTSGTACSLTVTETAVDQCVGAGTTAPTSVGVGVRVDREPPTISCSVTEELLWPADERLVDIGLSVVVSDNCDGTATPYTVFVTSDEPTAFNLRQKGDQDPAPDAFVDLLPGGAVQRVRLRAQRRQDSSDDGRVYRILVVATDSCGLTSQDECFVTVPKNYNPPTDKGMIVNSGQLFDATGTN